MKKYIKVILLVAILALFLPIFHIDRVYAIDNELEEEIVNNEEEKKEEETAPVINEGNNNNLPVVNIEQNTQEEEKKEDIPITNNSGNEEEKEEPVINNVEEPKVEEKEEIIDPQVLEDDQKGNEKPALIDDNKEGKTEDTSNSPVNNEIIIQGDKAENEGLDYDTSVTLSSQVYNVSDYYNYIYTGFSTFNINNISLIPGNNGPYTMEYNNNIVYIKSGNEVVRQYHVISLILNNGVLNNKTITVYGNFNLNNVNVNTSNRFQLFKSTSNDYISSDNEYIELIYNNSTLSIVVSALHNKMGETYSIDSFTIVENELNITSNLYFIDNNFGFVFTGFQSFNTNNISINSPFTMSYSNNKLTIKNGNETIKEYDVITLTLDNYEFIDDSIVMTGDDFDWNNINVIAGNSYSIYKNSMPDPYTFNGKFIALNISNWRLTVVKGEYQPNDGGDMSIATYPIYLQGGDTNDDLITITLNLNGGTGINQSNFTIEKGQTIMDIMSSYNLGNVEIYYPDRSKEFVGFVDASQNNVALDTPIYENLTIYAKWQNLTPVSYIDITIEAPTIDDEVEINNQGEPSIIPEIEWNENSGYGTHNPRYVILQNGEYDPLFEGMFEANTDYYVRIDLFPEDGYYLSDDTFDNITINGLLPSYVYIDRTNNIYYVVQAMRAEYGVGDTGQIPITFYNNDSEGSTKIVNVDYGKKLS